MNPTQKPRHGLKTMGRFSGRPVMAFLALYGCCFAQNPPPDAAVLDTIRTETQIGDSDQRRIGDWIDAQVNALKAVPDAQRGPAAIKFRELMRTQFENSGNSAAFKEQFATKTAGILVAKVSAGLDPVSGRTIEKVLIDFNRPETVPAFLAALGSKDAAVRMLAASGLGAQRTAIAADKARLDQVIAAIRDAAVAESDGVVLGRLYWALSVPPAQVSSVFDAFMAIFEKRLQKRKAGGPESDGAEVLAYEFFRTSGVIAALSQPQKEQLVRTVAEFIRLDARRYTTKNLPFIEIDHLQRLLDGGEEIIAAAAGNLKGGDVRGSLSAGQSPDQVLQQVYLWVGDAKANQPGALNAAPWNVPIGAP